MEIAELINSIASKQGCEVMKREQPISNEKRTANRPF